MVHADDGAIPAPALMSRVSWGAIFAGALCAIALTALLTLLGLGIGFGTFDPAQGDSVSAIPKNTLIWWAIVSVAATGIGGFIAARLAGIPRGMSGALHGVSVWALATIVTLWLATTAIGTILGAAGSVVTTTARITASAAGSAGQAAIGAGSAVAPSSSALEQALRDQGITRERVRSEAGAILAEAGIDRQDVGAAQQAAGEAARNIARQPGSAGSEIDALIDRMFNGPDAVLSPQERQDLVTAISERSGVSRGEAEQIATRWQAQAETAAVQVRNAGGTALDRLQTGATRVSQDSLSILSKAAWGMFLISLVGLLAAILGAAIGAPSFSNVAAMGGARVVHDED